MKKLFSAITMALTLSCGGHWVKQGAAQIAQETSIPPENEAVPKNEATNEETRHNYGKSLLDVEPGETVDISRPSGDQSTTRGVSSESSNESLQKAEASRKQAKAKKTKAIPVTYSGNEFIREVLPGKPVKTGTIVTINGNASIRRSTMTLKANKIEIFGEDAAYARATGNLRISDTASSSQLKAAIAEFYKLENKIVIRGMPVLKQKNKKTGKVSTLRCDTMERDLDKRIVRCLGDVSLENAGATVYAQKAEFNEKTKVVQLTGEPRAFRENDILLADTIRYYIKTGDVEAVTKVKVLLTQISQDKQNTSTLVTSIVQADHALTQQGETIYLKQKTTLTGKPVIIRRDDSSATGDKVEIWGPGAEEVLATGHVTLQRQEDGSRVSGHSLRFFKVAGLARMPAEVVNGKKIRPQADFFDKKGKLTGSMSAELLERNALLSRTQARGFVKMTMQRDNGQTLIRGEWADIDEKQQLVTVRGNPFLDEPNGKIYAQEILLFVAEKRIELLGPIQGAMFSQSPQ